MALAVREVAKETPGAIYVFIGSQGNIAMLLVVLLSEPLIGRSLEHRGER